MNEIEIIRSQVASERAHAAEVAHACAAVFGSEDPGRPSAPASREFRDACVAYLVWVLARFEERDQTLSERLLPGRHARPGAGRGPEPAAVLEILGREGTSREALARLEAALSASAPAAWREFARFFDSAWSPRRSALDGLLDALRGVADWRAVCAIDADSILEERARFARVVGQLPPGIALRAPQARQAR